MNITLNPNKKIVDKINRGLKENVIKYGKPFCPCVLEDFYTEDVVCPCKEFREMKSGVCKCGKFIKGAV